MKTRKNEKYLYLAVFAVIFYLVGCCVWGTTGARGVAFRRLHGVAVKGHAARIYEPGQAPAPVMTLDGRKAWE